MAVTVYELAIKDVLITFSQKKHNVFGSFVEASFERVNGRISLDDLKRMHVPKFGEKYATRFKKNLREDADIFLAANRRDMRSAYSNIVTWRHVFVHQGNIMSSYGDVVQAYEDGKEVIGCLARTMVR